MSADSASEHEAPSGEPGGASAFPGRCARHEERLADVACARCGDYACAECHAAPPYRELCEPCAALTAGEPVPWDLSRDPLAWLRTVGASFSIDGIAFRSLGAGRVSRALAFSTLVHLAGAVPLWWSALLVSPGMEEWTPAFRVALLALMVISGGVGPGLLWPLVSAMSAHAAMRVTGAAPAFSETLRVCAYAQGTTLVMAIVAVWLFHGDERTPAFAALVAGPFQHGLFVLAVGRWARGRLGAGAPRAAWIAAASIAPITLAWGGFLLAVAAWARTITHPS